MSIQSISLQMYSQYSIGAHYTTPDANSVKYSCELPFASGKGETKAASMLRDVEYVAKISSQLCIQMELQEAGRAPNSILLLPELENLLLTQVNIQCLI